MKAKENERANIGVELLEEHKDAFLDFGKISQSTIKVINATLKEMIREYGVRPLAIAVGNEKNFRQYFKSFNMTKTEEEEKELDHFIFRFEKHKEIARVHESGIFFCEYLWEEDADRLRSILKQHHEQGFLKYDSLEGTLIHEYAHLLYYHSFCRNRKKEKTFANEVLGEMLLMRNDNQGGSVISAEIVEKTIGEHALEIIYWFVNEAWADLMACYYEDKNKGSEILSDNTESFVRRMLDKYFKFNTVEDW
jgi:hypothetical protein